MLPHVFAPHLRDPLMGFGVVLLVRHSCGALRVSQGSVPHSRGALVDCPAVVIALHSRGALALSHVCVCVCVCVRASQS